MNGKDLLEKILTWAKVEDSVRVIIQTGSHTRQDNTADELSDLDIELFVDDLHKYTTSDKWMHGIEEVWMYLPLENSVGDPTRLVIFKEGIKVDFTLNKAQDFVKLVDTQADSDLFSRGYQVLLDKDDITSKLQTPEYKNLPTKIPSQAEFSALVEEFFFESFHVAKYLKRNDLWSVKFRDWTTKELLLKMIEWYEKSIHVWDYDTWYLGQKIEKWIEKDLYKELQLIFAHFDQEDSVQAMDATINLFRKIAKQTALNCQYLYPEEIDKNITGYINKIALKS